MRSHDSVAGLSSLVSNAIEGGTFSSVLTGQIIANAASGGGASNLNNTVTLNSIQSLTVVNVVIDSPTETPTLSPFAQSSSSNIKSPTSQKYYSIIVIIVIPIAILIFFLCRKRNMDKDSREPDIEIDEENSGERKNPSQNIKTGKPLTLESSFQVLGVRNDANTNEIKRAYKRLCLQYHPDKNDTDEAKVKFLEVKEAYSNIMNYQNVNRNNGYWGVNPVPENEEKKNYM